MKELFKQWCEETKRNGSVLVSGSIYEFFEWMVANNYTVIKGKVEQVEFYYEEGDGSRVAFIPKSKEALFYQSVLPEEGSEDDYFLRLDKIYNDYSNDKIKHLFAIMKD